MFYYLNAHQQKGSEGNDTSFSLTDYCMAWCVCVCVCISRLCSSSNIISLHQTKVGRYP